MMRMMMISNQSGNRRPMIILLFRGSYRGIPVKLIAAKVEFWLLLLPKLKSRQQQKTKQQPITKFFLIKRNKN